VVLEIRACGGGCRFRLRVRTKAPTAAVAGSYGGALKISVKEAPERGKANRAVVALLARALGVRATSVRIVAGETSPDKTVEIADLSAEECRARLGAHAG